MFGRTRTFFTLLAAGVILLGGAVAANATGSSIAFPGSPASPAAYSDPHLDVAVHSRNQDTWYSLEGMTAQHGADCSAPPATHVEIGSYSDAVFQCANHLMTSINAGGYGEIMLTPDTLADFSAGTATITWDVSTFRSSGRDWWDVWLTPFTESKVYPLQSWLPDLSGPPADAVHLMLGTPGTTTLCPEMYRGGQSVALSSGYGNGCVWWTGYESILTSSATVRTTFKAEISKTHLKVYIPAQASTNQREMVFFDGAIPGGLPFTQAVVQFGHHSYTPTKTDGCASGDTPCQPGTWHWDNLSISPGVPFTMIKPDRRYADASNPTITFASPAPAGAYLRFHAVANAVKASFNGGPLVALTPLYSDKSNIDPEYFVPVPAGTQRVTLSVTPSWLGSWIADGFGIWSLTAQSDTPTPAAPTSTATPTNTVAPTRTPTVAPTSTPTAQPTNSPTISPTSIPTPSTPSPSPTWTENASTSSSAIQRGKSLTLKATVVASRPSIALVDIEVYGPGGQKVFQTFWDNQSFGSNVARSFNATWKIPSSAPRGTYVVKVGVFKPGWGQLHGWNDAAATFSVK